MNILLSCTSHPASTAAFMEKALRKHHDVITYGPSVNDTTFETDVIKAWNLESIQHRIKKHDIPLFSTDLRKVLGRLPYGWHPDLFLWIETGLNYPIEGIEDLPCVSVCYLIDTNFHFDQHVRMARRFDLIFLAAKPYVHKFRKRGIENAFWLPVACDPDIHGKKANNKLYDICFVGTLINSQRRLHLIDKIKSRFHFHYERCFLERMAKVFSQSRIVFNVQPADGFNMRVFEGMASGSMLLTDETKGSGLSNMFENRKHLVLYHNETELIDLAEYYLKNHAERERIARQGMVEVLAEHTYEDRSREITDIAGSFSPQSRLGHFHLKERPSVPAEPRKFEEPYYLHQMEWVAGFVPTCTERILDVGCKTGILGRRLIERGAKEVVGIDPDPVSCEIAGRYLTDVICCDIENLDVQFPTAHFDCIIFSDILEHLRDPLLAINQMKPYLSKEGVILACIPNIRYWAVIQMIVDGHWRYQDYGILDRDHIRFFTENEIRRLFDKAGLCITKLEENLDSRYKEFGDQTSGEISFGRVTLKGLSEDDIRELFVDRYLVVAKKKTISA